MPRKVVSSELGNEEGPPCGGPLRDGEMTSIVSHLETPGHNRIWIQISVHILKVFNKTGDAGGQPLDPCSCPQGLTHCLAETSFLGMAHLETPFYYKAIHPLTHQFLDKFRTR